MLWPDYDHLGQEICYKPAWINSSKHHPVGNKYLDQVYHPLPPPPPMQCGKDIDLS